MSCIDVQSVSSGGILDEKDGAFRHHGGHVMLVVLVSCAAANERLC